MSHCVRGGLLLPPTKGPEGAWGRGRGRGYGGKCDQFEYMRRNRISCPEECAGLGLGDANRTSRCIFSCNEGDQMRSEEECKPLPKLWSGAEAEQVRRGVARSCETFWANKGLARRACDKTGTRLSTEHLRWWDKLGGNSIELNELPRNKHKRPFGSKPLQAGGHNTQIVLITGFFPSNPPLYFASRLTTSPMI